MSCPAEGLPFSGEKPNHPRAREHGVLLDQAAEKRLRREVQAYGRDIRGLESDGRDGGRG